MPQCSWGLHSSETLCGFTITNLRHPTSQKSRDLKNYQNKKHSLQRFFKYMQLCC
jgi:hypothetical protein